MVVGEEERCGKTWEVGHEGTLKMEEVEHVMAGVAEGRFGLMKEGVVKIHEKEVAGEAGLLAVNDLEWEAGGQNGLAGVEGLEQRD